MKNEKLVLITKYGKLLGKPEDVRTLVPDNSVMLKMKIALSSKMHNNCALVGPAGTGKTASVCAFAASLENTSIYEINLNALMKDYPCKADLGKKLENLFEEASDYGIILFFDEGHRLCNNSDSTSIANMLKPLLTKDTVRVILATTDYEFERFISDDPAMVRRFTKIIVEEPTEEKTEKILAQTAKKVYPRLGFTKDLLHYIVASSSAFAGKLGSNNPDRSLTLLDYSASLCKSEGKKKVDKNSVDSVMRDMYNCKSLNGICPGMINKSEMKKSLFSSFPISKEEAEQIIEALPITPSDDKAMFKGIIKLYGNDTSLLSDIASFCAKQMGHYEMISLRFSTELKVKEPFARNKTKAVIIKISQNTEEKDWAESEMCKFLFSHSIYKSDFSSDDEKWINFSSVPVFLIFEQDKKVNHSGLSIGFNQEKEDNSFWKFGPKLTPIHAIHIGDLTEENKKRYLKKYGTEAFANIEKFSKWKNIREWEKEFIYFNENTNNLEVVVNEDNRTDL